ncbi:MAG: nitroreductase family protein [Kurthia sp.]|nr:nitroreductase family protein [Candidatus Kurthia equi]
MSTTTKSAVIETMYARTSVRKYDATYKMSKEELSAILTDAITAPSTSNMQPWRFLVITDEEAKQKLLPIAFNQKQIVDASAIIAVQGDANFHEKARQIHDLCKEAGFMTEEVAETQTQNSEKLYGGLPLETRKAAAMYDAGLVSMQITLAAKDRGLDTVIMGGYNKPAFAEAFNLPENEFPIVLIAIGKSNGETNRGTARLSVEDVARFI